MPHLDTFSGQWNKKNARHLLNRTSFGINTSLVNHSLQLGLEATIDKLFEINPLPSPPLKYELDGTGNGQVYDPDVNYGETWVNAPPIPDLANNQEVNKAVRARNKSLYAWSFLQMQNAGINIREKLTLFWHNHFVAVNTNPHREYYYINTIRNNALGNFKQLVKEVTVDPNMLSYLSGSQNTDSAPNENYSRELLELFTIGKGAAVGNGDYTNYTEEDVVQMARVLTGWRVRGLKHDDTLNSFFSNYHHTKGVKQLSHRFNNDTIIENGENEYEDLIDKIFEQEECSKFIARQLYLWFVSSDLNAEIEENIINPLSEILRNNNYEITPALKILLSSDHFFESTFCMIKSPIDLMFSVTKSLLVSLPNSTTKEEYEYALILYLACSDLNQSIFHHPDVAGWKAYYQEPLFYKNWVNSYLLPKRLDFCRILVTGGELTINKTNYNVPPLVPVLEITSEISNAEDPNILINELANQLFNYEITNSQKESLKDILIPGLPDFEWTAEYSAYLEDPTNTNIASSVDKKLRDVISIMVQMSEFQIM